MKILAEGMRHSRRQFDAPKRRARAMARSTRDGQHGENIFGRERHGGNEALSTFAVAASKTRRNSDNAALIRQPLAMRIDSIVIHPH